MLKAQNYPSRTNCAFHTTCTYVVTTPHDFFGKQHRGAKRIDSSTVCLPLYKRIVHKEAGVLEYVTQLDDPCHSYLDLCMDQISRKQRNIV